MAKDVEALAQWLPSIALFGGLEERTLRRLIGVMQEHRFEKGQLVCEQGEAGRAMYVILEGEVVVIRAKREGGPLKLVRMHQGEFFGEMTLIDIQKRSATVRVEKPSVLLSLSNRDLFNLYKEDTAGYVMVLQNLCRELSRRLRVTNDRLQSLAEASSQDDEATMIRPSIKRRPI